MKAQRMDDLKAKVTREIEAIEKEVLHNAFIKTSERLNFCIPVGSYTFEQYL